MSTIADWFKGFGGPAQRGQPQALAPYQRTATLGALPPYSFNAPGEWPRNVRRRTPVRFWFGSHTSQQRGEPAPLGPADLRPPENFQFFGMPGGIPAYRYTRRYDRGAAAFSFNEGKILSNPIGAGIVPMYRQHVHPTYIGEVLPYGYGIYWRSQAIAAGQSGPTLSNLLTPRDIYALMGGAMGAAAAEPPAASAFELAGENTF